MSGEVIQGLDVVDVLSIIGRKNKKFQAILLQELEEVLGKDSKEFLSIRKIILDGYNDYTRSVLRTIFGEDFEYIQPK